MSRRSSCQKMIMIAYFGFQNGCLATRRREKEKQRRTRAARQRAFIGALRIPKKTLDADLAVRNRLWNPPRSTLAGLPVCVEHARHRLLGGSRDNKPSQLSS